MGVDLEAAERLAKEPGVNPLARDAIRDLVQEVRRLQFFEALDKTMTELAPELDMLAPNDTCAAEREQYMKERDEARRQLADLNASYAAADRYWSEKLTVAREALEWIERETHPEDGRLFEGINAKAREALAKIGGSDA